VAHSYICSIKSTSGILNIFITCQSAAGDMALKAFSSQLQCRLDKFSLVLSPSFLLDEVHLLHLNAVGRQRPCLPTPCPGSEILAGSIMLH